MSKRQRKALQGKKVKKSSPIRAALTSSSPLHAHVKNGLGALEKRDRKYVDVSVRADFGDSLEIDANIKELPASDSSISQQNRWDYLLGHSATGDLIALEPHSANTGEVSVVIKKKMMALHQLRAHFPNGIVPIKKWFWVASGPVNIVPLSKKKQLLYQNGIVLVGRLLKKHL